LRPEKRGRTPIQKGGAFIQLKGNWHQRFKTRYTGELGEKTE